MKVHGRRIRWMLRVLALLVCCMVVLGCQSWPLKRAIEATKATKKPVPKAVLVWLEGTNIRTSEEPVKVYAEKTFIYWMSNEKISIGYKDPESVPHKVKCDDDDNGTTVCRSKTFESKKHESGKEKYSVMYYIEIESKKLKLDPEIEVLE